MSARILLPQLSGKEAWLCPWGPGGETIREVEERLGIPERVQLAVMLLRTLPYEEYLRSDHWQAVRTDVFKNQRNTCAFCPQPIRDVHHVDYDRKGFERNEDVIGVCRNCHGIEHNATVAILREQARNLLP